MHLKNPYTHGNEKAEYEVDVLAGPIFSTYICVLQGTDPGMVLRFTATGLTG